MLRPSLAGTSGGQRDVFSSADNILSSNPGAGYVTAPGVTKVNIYFKSEENLELTRMIIKVHSILLFSDLSLEFFGNKN